MKADMSEQTGGGGERRRWESCETTGTWAHHLSCGPVDAICLELQLVQRFLTGERDGLRQFVSS